MPPRTPSGPRATPGKAPALPGSPKPPAVGVKGPVPPVAPPAVGGSATPFAPPAANRPVTPSSPSMRSASEAPSEGGWDDPTDATARDLDATPRMPEAKPRVKTLPPQGAAVPPPASSSGGALTTSTREEIWIIVRAAVDAALQPALSKQRDLEARLVNVEAALSRAVAAAAATTSTRPPADTRAEPARRVASEPPAFAAVASAEQSSYGVVVSTVPSPPATLDLSKVEPFDMPDFGGKRRVGSVLVVLILLVVGSAVVATVLSHM